MIDRKNVILVIPAYEPDEKMIQLLQNINSQAEFKIVVVDDGSGEVYAPIFAEAEQYAYVISYKTNQGKGYALKTAFSHILNAYKDEAIIVTADSDGQHKVEDIVAVVQAAQGRPDSLILGSREFAGKVPLKSRFGNSVTSKVFELSLGTKVGDTQTGLRAFQSKHLPYMLQIGGNRYQFEMNMLLHWVKDKRTIYEQPIETIYLDKNIGSHFHPIKDSYEIYKDIIKFSFSSGIGFLIDYILYSILIIATQGLPVNLSIGISNISARIVSAMINYIINRKFVFKDDGNVLKTATQYAILAFVILILNTLLLSLLVDTFIPNRFIAKIIVELILFLFSCFAQKKVIFKHKIAKEQC
ncbi:MAG: GtrA family protein [Aminipila sp.]